MVNLNGKRQNLFVCNISIDKVFFTSDVTLFHTILIKMF